MLLLPCRSAVAVLSSRFDVNPFRICAAERSCQVAASLAVPLAISLQRYIPILDEVRQPASHAEKKGANTQNRTKIERERPREKEGKIVKNQPLVSPKCRERFLCNTFTFCPTRLAQYLTTYHLPARIEKATEEAKRLHRDSLPVKVPLALKPNRAIALTASKLLSAGRLCATAAAAQSRQHHYNPAALLRSDFELSSKRYVYSSH